MGAASFYMLKKIGLYIMCIICRGTVNFFNTRFQNIQHLVVSCNACFSNVQS